MSEMNADGLPTVLAAHLAVLGCDLTGHRRMQNDSLGTVDYVELPTLGTAYDYIALASMTRVRLSRFQASLRLSTTHLPPRVSFLPTERRIYG